MDIEQVENGLRVLEVAEPPLGFDVDVLVTKAAARQRRRRGLLVSAGTVFAAIGTAVTLVVVNTFATPSPVVDKAAPPSVVVPPRVDLAMQMERNRRHLEEVLPAVKPDAGNVVVNPFTQYGFDADGAIWGFSTLADPVSVSGFDLTINGPAYNWEHRIWSENVCVNGFSARPWKDRIPWKTPEGGPQPCKAWAQPDGTTVLIAERRAAPPASAGDYGVMHSFNAIHFRPDGSSVSLFNVELSSAAAARNPPPFTKEQVIKLVTDPAFTVN